MKKHSPLFVAATLALWTFAGCATTPPELVEARSSYRAASMGPAGQLALTELYDAKKVLDQAEREFAENGATRASRDYAYVAQRKVQLADVKARTEADRKTIAEGAFTAPVLLKSATALSVEMPIVSAVCALLAGTDTVEAIATELLARPLKSESW